MTDFIKEITAKDLMGSKIEAIAKLVLGKDKISDEQLELMFQMAAAMQPMEMNISAGEKRQTRQYESNDYFISMKISLEGIDKTIFDKMRSVTPAQRPAVFDECRSMLYALISLYYKNNENLLRALLTEQQKEDGILRT